MVMEFTLGKMEDSMRDSTRTTKSMGMGSIPGLIRRNMQDGGMMGSSMG